MSEVNVETFNEAVDSLRNRVTTPKELVSENDLKVYILALHMRVHACEKMWKYHEEKSNEWCGKCFEMADEICDLKHSS